VSREVAVFRAVFVRHGGKQPTEGRLEYDVPLDRAELGLAAVVKKELHRRGIPPLLWVCSHFAHCWQTADVLAGSDARVVRVSGLTPFSASEGATLRSILNELGRLEVPVQGMDCIGVVGHEERLSNLLNTLHSGPRIPPLERLEAVSVIANSLYDLDRGQGQIECRLKRPTLASRASG